MKPTAEDGVNAGYRNFGRLALMCIPFALGIGASVWLGAYIGVHDFEKQLSQEGRAAIAVGAAVRPTAKIKIEIKPQPCAAVTRADLEGQTLRLYATNDCGQRIRYMVWKYAFVSPNGTVLKDGWTNLCPLPAEKGDKAECLFESWQRITVDDRAATVRVWTEPMF